MNWNGLDREALEHALGYTFREPGRLLRALTHCSFSGERVEAGGEAVEDNEVLELLGDAVLGLVVIQGLVEALPGWSVGRLSQAKSRVVSARSLHAAALRLGLSRFLLVGRGEEKSGVRDQRDVLADTYEALVGAIFLDGGLEAAAQFVRRTLLDDQLQRNSESLGLPDEKSALMEWCQGHSRGMPEYRVVRESGPDHRKIFEVEVRVEGRALATAEGRSKKEAEQTAAELALARLRAETEATCQHS